MVSSSSSTIGSSYISGCSPVVSSASVPPKKREGWLYDVVGVLGRNYHELSLFLRGMKGNLFLGGFFFFIFVPEKLKLIEQINCNY